MYRPTAFAEDRIDVLSRAITDIQLATLVTPAADDIHITHVPMFVKMDGDTVTLEAHIARANPHWQNPGKTVAIFQGPQAYISPSYYPSKHEHQKVVPTWAYIAVHAHGTLEAVTDAAWLHAHLNLLTDANEAPRDAPWAVSDAPDNYVAARMRGIVGLRLAVTRIEGSWKINQNKPTKDRDGTEAGLRQAGGEAVVLADALAKLNG